MADAFEPGSPEAKTYQEMIAAGKTHVYAHAYASKIQDGEVFARHFAIIRYEGCSVCWPIWFFFFFKRVVFLHRQPMALRFLS
jgi:hypothetical protein